MRFFDVHPENPQPRAVAQIVELLESDGVIVYPTDSSFALGCRIGNAEGIDRMRRIRQVDPQHQFTLVCSDFSQVSQFVTVSNAAFRIVKACTPGEYTFILPATREVPRRMLHPKRKTVGVRIPRHPVVRAILTALGEPLVSTTLLLPGEEAPMTQAWEISERLDGDVDAVIDAGECGIVPTTVVDLTGPAPEVLRVGGGDTSRFD